MAPHPIACPHCSHPRIEWDNRPVWMDDLLPRLVLHGVDVGRCAVCDSEVRKVPGLRPLMRRLARWVSTQEAVLADPEVEFLRKWMGWSADEASAALRVGPWCGGWIDEPARDPAHLVLRLLVAHQLGGSPLADFAARRSIPLWGTMPPADTIWLRAQYLRQPNFWLLQSMKGRDSAMAPLSPEQLSEAAQRGEEEG